MLSPQQYARLQRLRWSAFAIVGGAYMLSFFHRFAPSAIAADLQQSFDMSATALGGLAAAYFYVYTLMQIPTGVLADTLGPRRLVTIGGVVAAFGSLLFGYAESFSVAVLGRLLIGLGVSVVFISLLKLNASWFSEGKFGTMAGLTLLMGNLGSLFAATPLAWALDFTSWRHLFGGLALLSLLLSLLTWWRVRDEPTAMGFPSMRALQGRPEHAARDGHWYRELQAVARNRASWPGFFVNFGIAGTVFAFAGLWLVPLLTEGYGWSRSIAALHSTLLLAGLAVGAFFIGSLSDRIGRRRPVMIGTALLYLICWLPLLLALPLTAGWSHLLFLLLGIGSSSFTLSWACAKEVNRHANAGMATSLVNTGAFLGAALLQPAVGWVVDESYRRHPEAAALLHYQHGVWLLAGVSLLGVMAAWRVRETRCRYVGDER